MVKLESIHQFIENGGTGKNETVSNCFPDTGEG